MDSGTRATRSAGMTWFPTSGVVDDGGTGPRALRQLSGFLDAQPRNGGGSLRRNARGAFMSAVEQEQPEAAKHRFAKDQLKAFVERIERLEEEKKAIADDIRDVYAESKANGFDVKALRSVVRLRKQDVNERTEHQLILETYMNALGMLAA
jgi:uncharacterized protein (UPF0335 family)